MQPTIIVSHAEDPDGVISAAIAASAFEEDQAPYDIHLIQYSEQPEFYSNLVNNKRYIQDRGIIICDLNTNDSLLGKNDGLSNLDRLAAHAKSLTILDHHDGTKKHQDFLVTQCGVDVQVGKGNQCAATIAKEYFGQQDSYFSWLASLAQEHDYPTGNKFLMKTAKDLQGIIALYIHSDRGFDLLELTESLQTSSWYKEGEYNQPIQEDLAEFLQKATPSLEQLQTAATFNVADRNFKVTLADAILPAKDTARHFRDLNAGTADGYFVLFKKPRNAALLFRDQNTDFDAVPFCNFMGGGGRNGNGGFNFNVSNIAFYDMVDSLKSKAKQFYEQ